MPAAISPDGSFTRYGLVFPPGADELTVELCAFHFGMTAEEGGLGKAEHFWNCADLLWGHDGCPVKVEKNPWAVEMIEAACENDYLAVASCGSGGKTFTFGAYAVVTYLSNPLNTRVMVTSTDLKAAKGRIWGAIVEFWQNLAPTFVKPGKLVDSMGQIKFLDPDTGSSNEMAGIYLVAGAPSKEAEAVGKLIGFKRPNMLLIADELPELGHSILEAGLTAMRLGADRFQMIGLGNPASYYDPFGRFAEPIDGWKLLGESDHRWKTKYGICLHFDGEKSPNVLRGEILYPGLMDQAKLDVLARNNGGRDTIGYWRFARGFWSPAGSEEAVYSEQEIEMHDGSSRSAVWRDSKTRVMFFDPAFSVGNDAAAVLLGWVGKTTNGLVTLLTDEQAIYLTANPKSETPISYQFIGQIKELAGREGVTPFGMGLDSTGGGATFADALMVEWSPEIYRCYFGGSPSERRVSDSDTRKGTEAFTKRVAELWFAGKPLLRTGQLRGLGKTAIREMTARRYTTRKSGASELIELETKIKMRHRLGFSPNVADCVAGMIDLCRERFGLVASESAKLDAGRGTSRKSALKQVLPRNSALRSEKTGQIIKFSGFSSLRKY